METEKRDADAGTPHSLWDDMQAIVTGALFFALALLLLRRAGLMTGGTPGLAFLAHYASSWPLGAVLFSINLPFYAFAWAALGAAFTVKTVAAVSLVAVLAEALPRLITIADIEPAFAAVMGGLSAGVGILMLIRHGGSLGGLTVLAVFVQKRWGWRGGVVQGGLDAAILGAAFLVLPAGRVALSLLGAIALNAVIAINHRSGRYYGT